VVALLMVMRYLSFMSRRYSVNAINLWRLVMTFQYDGLVSLEIGAGMILTDRECMALFDAIADHLRELGYEPDGFSVKLKVDLLEK